MKKQKEFLEDLSKQLDFWTDTAARSISDPNSDLTWVDSDLSFRRVQTVLSAAKVPSAVARDVVAECLRGFAVSMLTILDGATSLSETGRVYLVNEQGERLGDGLHDEFVGHLIATGRLK